jgi:type II secretion system protein H
MPISTTRVDRSLPCRSCKRTTPLNAGFTLLELTLVILIISVMVGLIVPRLRDPGRTELDAQAHRLIMTFRLLRSEAALNGYPYRLIYDLNQQRYWATPDDASADLAEFAENMGSLARGTQFHDPVGFADIVLPTLAGKVAQGQIYTVFYPDGTVDPTVIHLTSGRDAVTLWLNPMNGRLNVAEGYQDVNYTG